MIKEAIYMSGHIIQFIFTDGSVKTIDFLPIIQKRSIWKRFLKPENFKKFKHSGTRLYWPGNLMDFHTIHLKEMPDRR